MNAPARLGLVALVILAGGGSLMTHGGVTTTRLLPAHDITLTASDATSARQSPTPDGAAVDLYGNEVSDAIATYSLDPTGSLYELHSPQTELPRLAEPKS